MRTFNLTLIVVLFLGVFAFAQDSTKVKNVKHETITRTVVTKGTNVETKVTETVLKEKQIIDIEDTGEENQNEIMSSEKSKSKNVVIDESVENKENDVLIKEIEELQKIEIEQSRNEQLKKAEMEKKIIDQRKEVKAMKEMEEKKKNKTKKIDN